MIEWVLHIDEATRVLAAGVIDETAASLPRGAEWMATGDGVWKITLRKAARLEGGRRAVRLVAQGDTLRLHAPASGAPMRRRLAIFGPIASEEDGTDVGARAEATLRMWRAGFGNPVDAGGSAEAERFRTNAAMLVLGAVGALDLPWDWFNATAGSRGRHSITLRPTVVPRGDLISFAASSYLGPG